MRVNGTPTTDRFYGQGVLALDLPTPTRAAREKRANRPGLTPVQLVEFEELWKLFPKGRRGDKSAGRRAFAARMSKGASVPQFRERIGRYLEAAEMWQTHWGGAPFPYWMMFSTFCNSGWDRFDHVWELDEIAVWKGPGGAIFVAPVEGQVRRRTRAEIEADYLAARS